MKKWHKRTLLVLTAGAIGTVALALRPAFTADEVTTHTPYLQEYPLPAHLQNSDFAFTHTINPTALHHGTYCTNAKSELLHNLSAADWNITVTCRDGKLLLSHNSPLLHSLRATDHIRTTYCAGIENIYTVRQPNGREHQEYQLCIACHIERTPSFWQPVETEQFLQFITVNVDDKAADLCTSVLSENWLATSRLSPVTDGPQHNLPARYCGTPQENAMRRLLHTLAACTEKTHARLTPRLIAGARALSKLADKDKVWPDCWGTSSDTARDIAYRVGPTLLHLAEKECYGNSQLINFINSDDFATIFGENFSDSQSSHPDIDLGTFEIRKISPKSEKN